MQSRFLASMELPSTRIDEESGPSHVCKLCTGSKQPTIGRSVRQPFRNYPASNWKDPINRTRPRRKKISRLTLKSG
jgi:hypothetical protein